MHYLMLILVPIVLFTVFSIQQYNIASSMNPQTSNQHFPLQKTINPENPKIQKYFQKVVSVPYKANYTSDVPKTPAQFWKDNSGDCDDKSVAFADYMYKIGAEDVKLVTIVHNSMKYAHCVVMWKNCIFDTAAEPPIYNMDKTKYYNLVQKKGFNLWFDYVYVP